MEAKLKPIPLREGTDLSALANEVCADKEPRVLERDGRPVALVLNIDDADERFAKLANSAFSEDWESEADSVFNSL
jgi:hypothetical protein